MIEKTLTIQNKLGIHARPAALIVETAARYNSDIKISKDGLDINGKSIMGVLMLAATKGTKLDFRVEGEDEEELMNAMTELFADKFEE